MMLEGKVVLFFRKVVREVFSEEMNVIRELRDGEGMSHSEIHLVILW